jgi:hypothetical protein
MSDADQATVINWRALSLKRLAYLDELKRTGRWKLHFASGEAIDQAIRTATDDAQKWKQLAHRSQGDQ